MRVLIVGAGPTGLTAAVELWRRGIKAEIIDKRDEASGLSRAVGITPRSLHLLEASGVTKRLVEEGVHLHGVRIYRGVDLKLALAIQPPEIKYGHDYIIGLAQDRTEANLREALEEMGGTVRYSIALETLLQSDEGVQAGFEDGSSETYDYVIAADGIRSTVREILGISYPGYELPEPWSIADVDSDDWSNAGLFTICQLEEGKVVVVVPLEEARYRLVSNTEDALAALPLEMNVTNVRRAGTFTISVRQVEEYQSGRVFLAGDAAHCHSPVGGRGMNLGIADACDLAGRLASGTQDGYTAARHADGAGVIEGSERVRKFVTSPSPVQRLAFLGVLRVLSAVPALQRRFSDLVLYG